MKAPTKEELDDLASEETEYAHLYEREMAHVAGRETKLKRASDRKRDHQIKAEALRRWAKEVA